MRRTVTTIIATAGLGLGLAPTALAAPSLEVSPTQVSTKPDAAPSWWLNPTEVKPGGEITAGTNIITSCPGGPAGPVSSPGFAKPLEFTGGNFGRITGKTTVTTVPGKYTATLKCKGTTVTGTLQFTVLGTPPTPRPTKTAAPTTTKKPQPQVVVPKGAPETGGGPN